MRPHFKVNRICSSRNYIDSKKAAEYHKVTVFPKELFIQENTNTKAYIKVFGQLKEISLDRAKELQFTMNIIYKKI